MRGKTCETCANLMRDYVEDRSGYVGGACRVSLFVYSQVGDLRARLEALGIGKEGSCR